MISLNQLKEYIEESLNDLSCGEDLTVLRNEELKLINPTPTDKDIYYRNKYNTKLLKKQYDENPYNNKLMLTFESIISSYTFNNIFINNVIDFVTNGVKKSKLLDIPDFLIVKNNFDNYQHEVFVGKQLNKLRLEAIPNFAYMFRYANLYDLAYNIIYEKIEGETFDKFLDNNKDEKIITNILLQLFFAIYYANKYLGFVHYDLHYKNIIVRELKEEKIITYI